MIKGVIYVAIGDKYIREAVVSAQSLKKHSPNLHVTLFTTSEVEVPCFDSVLPAHIPPGLDYMNLRKAGSLLKSPYMHTLYLDADTYICGDISDMFQLLGRCDIAMCFSSRRRPPNYTGEIPEWFPERNSGVILYQNTPKVMRLFEEWLDICRENYRKSKSGYDQVSMWTALYRNEEVCLGALSTEFNCRVACPMMVGSRVYIIHGHGDVKALAHEVTRYKGMRVYLPSIGIVNKKQNREAIALLRQKGD